RANAKEELLEAYFENKHRKELGKKNIKDMSWDEAHELNEIRKGEEPSPGSIDGKTEKPDVLDEKLSDDELFQELKNFDIKAWNIFSQENPELYGIWLKIEHEHDHPRTPIVDTDDEEQISAEEEVSISKLWNKNEPACDLRKKLHDINKELNKREQPYIKKGVELGMMEDTHIGDIIVKKDDSILVFPDGTWERN
ncbi:hypothetical protein KKF61_09240, partial [Patescibacteria group bacterium]|nr:hypothetical protein [Patescibacteria group bacterium]